MSFTAHYSSLTEAEHAAQLLIERGIPETAISVEDSMDELMQTLSLGAGVGVAATESLVDSHEDPTRFMLTVETGGDANRAEVCREILAPK